jgi:hypothetical protein
LQSQCQLRPQAFGESPSLTQPEVLENHIEFQRMLLYISSLSDGLFFQAFERAREKSIQTDLISGTSFRAQKWPSGKKYPICCRCFGQGVRIPTLPHLVISHFAEHFGWQRSSAPQKFPVAIFRFWFTFYPHVVE